METFIWCVCMASPLLSLVYLIYLEESHKRWLTRYEVKKMKDVNWVQNELYTCDDCANDFSLGTMRGNHQHLQCEECYRKPSKGEIEAER